MRKIIYLIRYRFHFWREGMPLMMALRYPAHYLESGRDPIEDADIEIEYMARE